MTLIRWIWDRGVVSTFLGGLFVVLPLVITLAIMGWVGSLLRDWLGPHSLVGQALLALGLRFVTDEVVATLIGWGLVLVAIWLLGVLVKSRARNLITGTIDRLINHLPIIKSVYRPVAQVVGMLRQPERLEMKRMSVVYCSFTEQRGSGFLGLLASADTYRLGSEDCLLVYLPTAPFPMTGGLLFLPARQVEKVDLGVEELLQIYFSLGVLSSSAVPARYRAASPVSP